MSATVVQYTLPYVVCLPNKQMLNLHITVGVYIYNSLHGGILSPVLSWYWFLITINSCQIVTWQINFLVFEIGRIL